MARTSVHLAVIVNDATSHAVRSTPRDETRWRLIRLKVLDVGLRPRPVRSKHLVELIDFKGMSADQWGVQTNQYLLMDLS